MTNIGDVLWSYKNISCIFEINESEWVRLEYKDFICSFCVVFKPIFVAHESFLPADIAKYNEGTHFVHVFRIR